MGYAFMLYNIHAQIVALQVTCDSEFEKHPPRLGIKPWIVGKSLYFKEIDKASTMLSLWSLHQNVYFL